MSRKGSEVLAAVAGAICLFVCGSGSAAAQVSMTSYGTTAGSRFRCKHGLASPASRRAWISHHRNAFCSFAAKRRGNLVGTRIRPGCVGRFRRGCAYQVW